MTADPTARPAAPRPVHGSVGAERVDVGSLERRGLRTGTAGRLLSAGPGVPAVIPDDDGWDGGPAEGGLGGLLTGTVLTAVASTAMVVGPAEVGSVPSTTGGGCATVGAGGGVRDPGRPADDVR